MKMILDPSLSPPMGTKSAEIHSLFLDLLSNLTEKERTVLTRRLGIDGDRETLQRIGDSYKITRERVRQIEDVGIKKMGRIVKTTPLGEVQMMGEKVLRMHGGLLARDRLVNAIITEMRIDTSFNENIIEAILQSDFSIQKSKPQLGVKTYFHLPEIQKKLIHDIYKEALRFLNRKSDVVERDLLFDTIKAALAPTYGKVENVLIDSVLDVFLDIVKGEEKYIGLAKWKILNPSTLKDKAIFVMKKEKRPFHFVDLTNTIANYFHESVKVPTVHNELIRNNEFVLIGRGIYVLKEWGYKAGTVLDVIIDVMSKEPSAHSTEHIIQKVLRVRQVKVSTIYMNLQNKQYIERVGRNLYRLKDSSLGHRNGGGLSKMASI